MSKLKIMLWIILTIIFLPLILIGFFILFANDTGWRILTLMISWIGILACIAIIIWAFILVASTS